MSEQFKFRSRMPASADADYRFHAEPDALERLTPHWENARVIARTGGIEQPGSRITLRVSVGPFSQDWISEHTACEPGKMFRDVWCPARSAAGSTLTNFKPRARIRAGWKTAWNMSFRWVGWEG
jgi:ligand-binding SRPBCC domain-containing protein